MSSSGEGKLKAGDGEVVEVTLYPGFVKELLDVILNAEARLIVVEKFLLRRCRSEVVRVGSRT
jgi:UDP-N-acetyl-D-mannosaminuronate dehydrogenase